MAKRDTSVSALAAELGVKPVTLYRYVDANGNLRDHGKRVLSAQRTILHRPASEPSQLFLSFRSAGFLGGCLN